eukprot:TRINITY_DN4650_c0_g1_i7.p1 TRINITY_DN4650_c0_g1~~TRINITY_DN4650_c0_g1_i7.p1  ORF type:complete len:380 (+),score=41.63 TRINITY_DN4650_c0_g1_i7:54-1193(+)
MSAHSNFVLVVVAALLREASHALRPLEDSDHDEAENKHGSDRVERDGNQDGMLNRSANALLSLKSGLTWRCNGLCVECSTGNNYYIAREQSYWMSFLRKPIPSVAHLFYAMDALGPDRTRVRGVEGPDAGFFTKACDYITVYEDRGKKHPLGFRSDLIKGLVANLDTVYRVEKGCSWLNPSPSCWRRTGTMPDAIKRLMSQELCDGWAVSSVTEHTFWNNLMSANLLGDTAKNVCSCTKACDADKAEAAEEKADEAAGVNASSGKADDIAEMSMSSSAKSLPQADGTYSAENYEMTSGTKSLPLADSTYPAKSHETSSGAKSLPEAEGTYSGENHEASPDNADESESAEKSISSRAKRMPRADDTYPVEADETPSDDAD